MNESEPLMTYRNSFKTLSKPRGPHTLGKVCAEPAYGAGDSRYKGGMNPVQAWEWNMGTCPLMAREICKREDPARENTDAVGRGGATRSSEEGFVMNLERRGCITQPKKWVNRRKEG